MTGNLAAAADYLKPKSIHLGKRTNAILLNQFCCDTHPENSKNLSFWVGVNHGWWLDP
jgi:hypothetical protein